MPVTEKKKFDERMQEVRNPKRDKVQYRKRKQQEDDAVKELKDYADRRAER